MTTVPGAQRFAVLVGTRPEIVKMSPLLREAKRRRLEHELIHSGQHYDEAMAGRFFRELELAQPTVSLRVREQGDEASQASGQALVEAMTQGLERVFAERDYGFVVVHGDTNTALAGALAASRCGLPIVHVEAGLRCGDLAMVEERNRREIDRLARWLFAPTGLQLDNLRREGLLDGTRHVSVVGNTIVDALAWMLPRLERGAARSAGSVGAERPILFTMHRAENARPEVLRPLLGRVSEIARDLGLPVVWPVHPRMRELLPDEIDPGIRLLDPLGWRDFLGLLQRSRLVLTDSGGVQEEAFVLRRPCVTLRPSTERPETLVLGANCVVDLGSRVDALGPAVRRMLGGRIATHPWGDGRSAARILDELGQRRAARRFAQQAGGG